MTDQNSLIIGPSNAGKTALLAAFLYAVSQFHQKDYTLQVQAQNDNTRHVLKHVVEFLRSGQLPFQGTTTLIDYDFLFSIEAQHSRSVFRWFQSHRPVVSRVHFVDSPGGSVFGEEGEEIDYAAMGEYRRALIEKLKKAEGLVLCVDAAEHNAQVDLQQKNGWIYAYLNDIFSRAIEHTHKGLPKLGVKRLFLCLNKCDLWALQEGYEGDAQESIHGVNPLEFAYQLLGQGFFNTLQTWFSPETELGFAFCSAYGFLDGGPNTLLLSGIGMGEQIQKQHVDAWRPFQVLDPFVFLASGKNFSGSVSCLKLKDLSKRLMEFR